ncbi:MAG: IS200/IS605 family transposase [Planctomycetes bacterium]|nr:IS200/IS605 family transposase [Planctomycetota bacterium]
MLISGVMAKQKSNVLESSRGSNAHYKLDYQVIWTTSGNAEILTPNVEEELHEIMREFAITSGIMDVTVNVQLDNVHIKFSCNPSYTPSKLINSMKSVSSRMVFQRFPKLKDKLGGRLWARAYILTTLGDYDLNSLINEAKSLSE